MSTLSPSVPRTPRPTETNEYAILKRIVRDAGLLDARPLYYWFKLIVAVSCRPIGR